MTKTVAIGIARMGSTRLPGKVMMELGGLPVIEWVVRSLRLVPDIDEVWIATSTDPKDNVIVDWCISRGVPVSRGSETDVLARVHGAAQNAHADIIVRVTCDCPFIDPEVVGQVVRLRQLTDADYASNVDPPTWPDGLDVEAMTFSALDAAHLEATRPTDRDCVTRFIARNRARFKVETLICPLPGMHKERWVLDTAEDYEFCRAIVAQDRTFPLRMSRILSILDKYPQIRQVNQHLPRNERFYDAVATEELPAPSFQGSIRALDRARNIIPLGAQTFSKSYVQYPTGCCPLYATHGDGAYLFDVDGNDYVDLVAGLLPVILGYRDPDVDEAVRRQLCNGITFSLSTELEAELAEIVCRLVPCAEMVRFGKNGSDVTAAAVRLARAYTGRNYILVGGYHGWHDWSIGTTERDLGVPKRGYSCSFKYGVDRLDDIIPGDVAGIIVEPDENPEYLLWLRQFCTEHGIVLIFDEVITGFRWSLGGAQQYHGVTPDLATFGKAMANGMPISAIAGKREIMKLMEPAPDRGNIFYSGTMFGETLSIAAAIACIKKLESEEVPDSIAAHGEALGQRVGQLVKMHDMQDHFTVSGHWARRRIAYSSPEIKTLFIREMAKRGVLIIDSLNMMWALRAPEIKRVVQAYDETLAYLNHAVRGNLQAALGDTPVIGQVSVRAYERS